MRALHTPRDRAAEELVRRHQASVRGFLVFLGCPPHLLDDLVQETFLSALSSRFEDRGAKATAAFLRTVARHLLLKALQKERAHPLVADLSGAEQAWTGFEREDGGEGYLAALRECLGKLTPRAHEVLELKYKGRLRRTGIAERLGLTESGVKSILVRAKKQLRECIERHLR